MLVKYLQYGPVSPSKLNVDVFNTTVNTELNHLRIQNGTEILRVQSSVVPFLTEIGKVAAIYFAQIDYEQGKNQRELERGAE